MLTLVKPENLYKLSLAGAQIFDVRSPSEFEDSHVPGAQSLPLLDDSERAQVGTLYKQVGAEQALARGLELFKSKVEPEIFEEIKKRLYVDQGHVKFKFDVQKGTDYLKRDGVPLVFYCWRGGARSKIMATVRALQGHHVAVVEGGHKAWRNEVLSFLNAPKYPFKLCTLYGLTGCGKTKLLNEWAAQGKPVIDLEGLASHRGSAFGQIGISKLGSQKIFEDHLYWQMRKLQERGVEEVFVEGESRRIGRCMLPEAFMNAMASGRQMKIEKTLDERVEHIIDEYIKPVPRHVWIGEAQRSLQVIQKRLGGEKYNELLSDLVSGNDQVFVQKLLVDYYDKAYAHTKR